MKQFFLLILSVAMLSSCGMSVKERNKRITDSVTAYILQHHDEFVHTDMNAIDSFVIDTSIEMTTKQLLLVLSG